MPPTNPAALREACEALESWYGKRALCPECACTKSEEHAAGCPWGRFLAALSTPASGTGWVRVEDRRPPMSVDVLVYGRHGHDIGRWRGREDGGWMCGSGAPDWWCPLPPPPPASESGELHA